MIRKPPFQSFPFPKEFRPCTVRVKISGIAARWVALWTCGNVPSLDSAPLSGCSEAPVSSSQQPNMKHQLHRELTSNPLQMSFWSCAEHFTKLLLTLSPKVNSFKVGNLTSSKLWLNFWPRVSLSKLTGKCTLSKLRLNRSPNVRLFNLPGKLTSSKLWSK